MSGYLMHWWLMWIKAWAVIGAHVAFDDAQYDAAMADEHGVDHCGHCEIEYESRHWPGDPV